MNNVKIKKLLLKNWFKTNPNPNANLVLDFTPHPRYQATYDRKEKKIILRVGNFKGFDIEDYIGAIYWALNHEAIHVAIDNIVPEIYNGDTTELQSEWHQVAGMDYLEDYVHQKGLIRPLKECYSKLHPKAFEFRKTFDVNFQ